MMSWNSYMFTSPSCMFMSFLIIFHDHVMVFLTSISVLIVMMIFFIFFFKDINLNLNENHQLEFLWTVVPMFILLSILIPSLTLLYYGETSLISGLSVVVVGNQWYWTYLLKDFEDLVYSSYMLPSDNSKIRLLEVDNRLILPFNTPLFITCTSSDVIHSWTVPSLGVKMDAIPGRLSVSCLSLSRGGIFFGQCSEICGVNHSFMPIVLESVGLWDYL